MYVNTSEQLNQHTITVVYWKDGRYTENKLSFKGLKIMLIPLNRHRRWDIGLEWAGPKDA